MIYDFFIIGLQGGACGIAIFAGGALPFAALYSVYRAYNWWRNPENRR